jgi:hypothetical protein
LSFSQLDESDQKIIMDELMLRIASIAGCNLPKTDFFAMFIAEEISHYILNFGFQELTVEEILLAFRLNSHGYRYETGEYMVMVNFTGHCLNVDYVSKVLSNYMTMRRICERKIQNQIDGYEL